MMTARQFADKYPGQPVKIAEKFIKHFGLQGPIGIVVGFKTGKLGMVGSSKVAIWREDREIQSHLEPRTDSKYHAVVIDAPNPKLGIYFLSVEYIELVSPVKPLKPVVVYPNHCEHCGSPCRNGKWLTICSNDSCKANKVTLKTLGPFLKFKTLDKNGYVLCPTCQINDIELSQAGVHRGDQHYLVCRNGHDFKHPWKDSEKILHRKSSYIWKNNQLTNH